ncbi:glycine/D-amino acid oxidase-like deaminating enzyme [Azospirillum brasilense]|uniref:Glycine/D-amino acid oxidase-like deaminating enzyme n=1 Tax=Azospirillum brasilense TaxID=192 RepID=A0A560BPY3_AZOBR|nr:FAD-binding oxidoreductase [Azospirillum brasilense]TWA74656.1 glycine/D-amino acid oxidase-like deaminating enzyme [Azospirillum brasilense]
MADRYDVVIVGGGVMGCAVAYFLANDPGFGGTVAVVERDPTYQRASSALSASSIRQQFSTPANIALSQFGLSFIRNATDHLSVDDDPVDLGLREPGYLYLATGAGADILRRNNAIQLSCGADVALLSPEELSARFPWLSVEGIALGSLGLSGEGWFDGYSLMQAFRRKAKALGVAMIAGEVAGIDTAQGKVTAVRLADGRRLSCGVAVNAAGPQARRVAALAGVDLPVAARKRCVFVFDCRDELPGCPLVIDPSGVWFRPEGKQFICGAPPPADRDPDTDDLTVEHDLFEEMMWPALAERVPAFEAIKVTNAWAGFYEYNEIDQNAIIGPHPELHNLLFCNGFSGHGLQQAPGAGRGLAELITTGAYRSLNLSAFAYERLAENRPLLETNVI